MSRAIVTPAGKVAAGAAALLLPVFVVADVVASDADVAAFPAPTARTWRNRNWAVAPTRSTTRLLEFPGTETMMSPLL